ncbi:hypothetical protein [Streptacidiphilus albus]|uniref:hypothetical protein n=1 Tax=Streptacidiphilus albus TaxID=105425 RepID=UPI00054B7A40|nr:hypothetical protein [Streptacidiphilus albus]
MLKIRNIRLTVALTATALAATGISLGTAGTAQAAAADCSVINIGSPGTIYSGTTEVGQVEQQYEVCGGVDYARAHYQWASGFASKNPNQYVNVFVDSSNYSQQGEGGGYASGSPDVWTNWVNIHSASPDTWQASANTFLGGGNCYAYGSWHAYANGANSGNSDGHC